MAHMAPATMVPMASTTVVVGSTGGAATPARVIAYLATMVAAMCTEIHMPALAGIVRGGMGTGTLRIGIGWNSENKSSELTTRKGVAKPKAERIRTA
jgi:hypothetical protein